MSSRVSLMRGLAHDGPYQVEEAQFMGGNKSYNFKPNTNLPTHYTPTLRNHENFSYGGGAQQGQRHVQKLSTVVCFHMGSKDSSQRAENQGQKEVLVF